MNSRSSVFVSVWFQSRALADLLRPRDRDDEPCLQGEVPQGLYCTFTLPVQSDFTVSVQAGDSLKENQTQTSSSLEPPVHSPNDV